MADIHDGSKFKPKNVLDELKKKSIKYSREVFQKFREGDCDRFSSKECQYLWTVTEYENKIFANSGLIEIE